MPLFHYHAISTDGQKKTGKIEADSSKSARSALRQQGWIPMTVELYQSSHHQGRGTFNSESLSIWTRQLAGLVSSGLGIEKALASLCDESDDIKIATLSRSLMERVKEGATFASSLSEYPSAFNQIYVAIVSASEEGGHLGATLLGLADQLESKQALRSKIIGAALYPTIVCSLAFCIIGFLVSYVVPQVASVFANQKKDLPLLTQCMLTASHIVRVYGLWFLLGLITSFFLFKKAMQSLSVRESFDAWILELPILGKMAKAYNGAQYGSTLAMLASAGVPIVKALTAASDTLSNQAMRKDALDIVAMVREGAPLGACLAQKKNFPKLLSTFVRLGEQTGDLPLMLSRASEQLGSGVQRKAMRLATLLEPLLIVIMGAIVMLIVASVLLPIVNMSSLAK